MSSIKGPLHICQSAKCTFVVLHFNIHFILMVEEVGSGLVSDLWEALNCCAINTRDTPATDPIPKDNLNSVELFYCSAHLKMCMQKHIL